MKKMNIIKYSNKKRLQPELPICPVCGKPIQEGKGIEHHYPVTREYGDETRLVHRKGCHQKDHDLFDRLFNEIITGNIQVDLAGNDPHADRRAIIKAALERKRLLP